MTDYKVTDTELTGIADAIRTKGGTQAQLQFPTEFVNAIGAIPSGITPTGNINITNMQSTNVAQYATAQVVDANLVAENIKKGVSILGVVGTYEGSGGVKIVPFATGTDEEIVAMIQAAHNGEIDLQQDGEWAVGDKRSISISAFTAKDKSVSAQTVDIAISSFDDYMSCGCVMQFDFVDAISTKYPMYNSYNTSGYDTSHPYTTILPALVNALPSYLKDMLIEFSCLASAGGSSTIETVTGNKLALRSLIEITGSAGSSYAGEGSQVSYYATSANRIKKFGHSGSADGWWTRSCSKNNNNSNMFITSGGDASQLYNYEDRCIAPFGCI